MSDFDPTKNRIPFGLLSEDEQTTLIHWPHGWEFYNFQNNRWEAILSDPAFYYKTLYRAKPAPVVTSRWINVYPNISCFTLHASRESADNSSSGFGCIAVLRIDTCNGVSTAHLEEI